MKEKGFTRVSLKNLHKMKSLTDWARFNALTDEDIEKAVASDPDTWLPTEEELKRAKLVFPPGNDPVDVGIDRDIVEWFGTGARALPSKINAALRQYIDEEQKPRKTSTRSAVVRQKPRRKASKRAAVKS